MQEKIIDDYAVQMQHIIGEGFSSKVYLATHLPTRRVLAVKVIPTSHHNPIQKLLLNNEIQAAKMIEHANVVKNEKVVISSNNCYLMMERCDGDLRQLLDQRRMSEQEVIRLFADIVQGYKAVADAGIIHRDLKAANIFLKQGRPKIGDFGFCDHIGGPKSKTFYNVGSPAYMSPQAYFDTHYSCKSDIWALGVLLFQMVTGKPLLSSSDYRLSIAKFKAEGLQNISACPLIKDLLSSCLHFDTSRRISPADLVKKMHAKAVPVTIYQFYSTQTDQEKANEFALQQLVVKGQLQVCTSFLRDLTTVTQFAESGGAPGIFQWDISLLLVKLINLKDNELASFFQGKNVFNLPNQNLFLSSPQSHGLRATFESIHHEFKEFVRQHHFFPLTDNENLNFLLLTVDEFNSKALYEIAQQVIVQGIRAIDKWTRENALFGAATKSFRCLYRSREMLKAYQEGVMLGEFLEKMAKIEVQEMSLSKLQVQTQQDGISVK